MDKKIKDSIFSILEANGLMTLSTINGSGRPESNSARYVYDDSFNIYFWSEVTCRHSKNIEKNKDVAVNIADSHQEWGMLRQGLQIEGKCYKVSDKDVVSIGELYMKRYPQVKKFMKDPKDFNGKHNSSLYKVEIHYIKIFDEKTFGKEVYKEVKLK